MSERVLTERELNRAVLARQGLLAPLAGTIPGTLAAIGGLQAQSAPSMYALTTVRAIPRLPAGLAVDDHGSWVLDGFDRTLIRVQP